MANKVVEVQGMPSRRTIHIVSELQCPSFLSPFSLSLSLLLVSAALFHEEDAQLTISFHTLQVTSSAKKSEHVFYISSSDHCTCPAFMHSIKADPTSLGVSDFIINYKHRYTSLSSPGSSSSQCKHIVAVLIGKYTNSLRKLTVSDDDLVDKYMSVNDLQELAGTR